MAEKTYPHLLRLGITKHIKLTEQHKPRMFQFLLESKMPAQIIPTMINGEVKIYVGFSEDKEEAFAQQTNSQPIMIAGDRLKTEQNYYIFIEPITNTAEITLSI